MVDSVEQATLVLRKIPIQFSIVCKIKKIAENERKNGKVKRLKSVRSLCFEPELSPSTGRIKCGTQKQTLFNRHSRIAFTLFLKASPGSHPLVQKISSHSQVNLMSGCAPVRAVTKRLLAFRKWATRHLHISHNTPFSPSKILHKHCLLFLLRPL